MNDKIYRLENGGFETESFRDIVRKMNKESSIRMFKSDCKCNIPEPQSKCSENGVSAYCGKCGKNYNKNGG
jgi:hypothetical protein